eukprot:TRINITY_DN23859_c0_g1_i1.p1 TRINITY_DN23859_c0_g1~~TRINITY_DN23859_c0_g1_i1.p1  ORF type:complete len:184 (+),score=59.64 TRINITY_DN23859_c0_g1_i1:304-855(+)
MADRVLRRRLKVLERTPEYERDDTWASEMAALKQELEGGGKTEPEPEGQEVKAERETEQMDAATPAPASTLAPAEPATLKDADKKEGRSATNMQHLASFLSLLQDLSSRTQYGVVPLLLTALFTLVLHPVALIYGLVIMHLVLLAFFVYTSKQSAQRNMSVYLVRDFMPSVAVAIVVGGAMSK